jgi:predicted nucleic acid-binding protein
VIKVVLDTNVFVSSFFGGNPRDIVNLWKAGEITLCLSRAIVDEYLEVLGRLGLQNERELAVETEVRLPEVGAISRVSSPAFTAMTTGLV